eukprot:TRINITY_DN17245_c0_g1_i1.p2 TRINITY_DN17245_c0_g1~~TRINITY_DN17245_c0_g1_i1.p2  ORF type:complete len:137 (-),score=47.68 TRINITY_DN17245_c0_g1_i1:126-500(-)
MLPVPLSRVAVLLTLALLVGLGVPLTDGHAPVVVDETGGSTADADQKAQQGHSYQAPEITIQRESEGPIEWDEGHPTGDEDEYYDEGEYYDLGDDADFYYEDDPEFADGYDWDHDGHDHDDPGY